MTDTDSRENPLFSILTPTWERAILLRDVWEGLEAQTFRSFEWLVGNDGSTDETARIVERLARDSDFRVVLVDADRHVGKSRIDNELIRIAKGELCLWCDSDDVLDADALKILAQGWRSIPASLFDSYVGVGALVRANGKVLGGWAPLAGAPDLTLSEVDRVVGADTAHAFRTRILRANPFPEVDLLVPEAVVWTAIGHLKIRFISHAIKRVTYGCINCISFSGKMRYSRGRAHALGAEYPYVADRFGLLEKVIRAINFVRYCLHGEITVRNAFSIWKGSKRSRFLLAICVVPGYIAALNDMRRGLVERTHVEFERARADCSISIKIFDN